MISSLKQVMLKPRKEKQSFFAHHKLKKAIPEQLSGK